MDAKYHPRDIKKAKEQEFLFLELRDMSIMEYATIFNELSYFSPTRVAIEEMTMDLFEQRLRGIFLP